MNHTRLFRLPLFAVVFPAILFLLTVMSCQYDYNPPSPGTIEIRLKTISTPPPAGNGIAFSAENNFVLTVTQVEIPRADGVWDLVYGDIKAFNLTPYVVNTLDTLARDSSRILGVGNAPPAHYLGVSILLTPGSNVTLDGYRTIRVLTASDFNSTLEFDRPFDILEGHTTRVTLTINLDSTLVRGAEVFYFRPYYYISSVIYE